jgi:hypothetical protein
LEDAGGFWARRWHSANPRTHGLFALDNTSIASIHQGLASCFALRTHVGATLIRRAHNFAIGFRAFAMAHDAVRRNGWRNNLTSGRFANGFTFGVASGVIALPRTHWMTRPTVWNGVDTNQKQRHQDQQPWGFSKRKFHISFFFQYFLLFKEKRKRLFEKKTQRWRSNSFP